jgi:F-type H+-transporting ATPase subunit b
MQINWFTVIAQVINFLILVWLLKHFLYKPVLNAIDEREKKIESQLKDADEKEKKAKKEQTEFAGKNETFDKQKKELMDKAIAETNEQKQKLLDDARNEANALRTKLEKSLKEMQENLNHEIEQKTQQEVFAIARKTFADLASMSLEEQVTKIFIKRLNDLKKEEKKQFVEAFKSVTSPILLQSAFDLPEKQKTEIKNAVNEILEAEPKFQFKTTPEIISGIELTTKGFKLAWSISEYLNSLQKNILETLNSKAMKDETKKVPEEIPIQAPEEIPVTKPDKTTEIEPKVKSKTLPKEEKTN